MRHVIAFAVLVSCGARTDLGGMRVSDAASDAPPDAHVDAHADVQADAPTDGSTTDCGASLASGPSWQTTFGPAQHVCLSPLHPPSCPSDALVYTSNGTGWTADTSSIADAAWVWRPGISLGDVSDLVEVTFTRTFVLTGKPSGMISIAADDAAEIRVNAVAVGGVGSAINVNVAVAAQSTLTTFDLGPYLVAGMNTIAIIGKNGPASYAGCSGSCTYAQNAAGVVFGGRVDCH